MSNLRYANANFAPALAVSAGPGAPVALLSSAHRASARMTSATRMSRNRMYQFCAVPSRSERLPFAQLSQVELIFSASAPTRLCELPTHDERACPSPGVSPSAAGPPVRIGGRYPGVPAIAPVPA